MRLWYLTQLRGAVLVLCLRVHQMIVLGPIVFFMMQGWVQEGLFRKNSGEPRFTHGGFLALLEMIAFTFLSWLELLWSRSKGDERELPLGGQRSLAGNSAPLRVFFIIAGSLATSRYLGLISLQHVNYPTAIMIKSSKLAVVMAGRSLINGKKYSSREVRHCFGLDLFAM